MSDARVPRIPAALSAPSLNRGVGFTHAQRRRLGLTGRLPSAVLTLDQQAERVWHQLQSLATDLGRNLLLEQLHYRHEVLYFKVLADHLPELMPVVYTPTVGEAIQRFSDEYRGQRGLFLSIDEPDEIEEAFNTLGLGPEDVDLIVCTDAEAILGIGDWGVGGIQIAVGKLALYTAGGGVDPRRCLAVSLDVGTDNEQLLADPFYLGNRHARRRGREYDEFVSRYIETAQRLFPRAILHFEDFGPANARKILDTYGTDYCVFNDDMQGTGAVVLAAVYSGLKVTGIPLRDQTIVVFGAGTAGMGIADQIRDAMVADGATLEQAVSQIWPLDRPGLLFDDMDDLRDFQVPYAKNRHQLGVAVGGSGRAERRDQDRIAHYPARLLNGLRSVHQRGGRGDDGVLQTPDDLSAVQPDVAHGSHPRRRAGVVEWQGAACHRQPSRPSGIRRNHLRHRSGQQRVGVSRHRTGRHCRWCPVDNQAHAACSSEGHCAPGQSDKSRRLAVAGCPKSAGHLDNGRRSCLSGRRPRRGGFQDARRRQAGHSRHHVAPGI
ncbi:[NAD]-dependent malate oxidoreductase [Mycobacterium tuberculosis]|nr:[NAD]-dependent malate oxidoreductase [Mycobacterium tuberculosis]